MAVKALNAVPNRAPGACAISVPADSAKVQGVEHLVREVSKTTNHVDILFVNAGATWGEKFDTHPDEAFAKVMDLNVKAVFNTIRLWVSMSSFSGGYCHKHTYFPSSYSCELVCVRLAKIIDENDGMEAEVERVDGRHAESKTDNF